MLGKTESSQESGVTLEQTQNMCPDFKEEAEKQFVHKKHLISESNDMEAQSIIEKGPTANCGGGGA